jgi:hypothetical protein
MQLHALNQILLEEQTITNYIVEGIILGYEFRIRYPFWRGTFLSCIEQLIFKVDQEEINLNDIYFTLNRRKYYVEELKELYKEYWFILDYATITIVKKGGISKGIHEITVEMHHRIPYEKQHDRYQVMQNRVTRALMAE